MTTAAAFDIANPVHRKLGGADNGMRMVRIVCVDEGRLPAEPVLLRLEINDPGRSCAQFGDVFGERPLGSGLGWIKRLVKQQAKRHPVHFDVALGPFEEKVDEEQLYCLIDELEATVRARYPDIDERVEAKHDRQERMNFLPDRRMIVQICRDLTRKKRKPLRFQAFLNPRANTVKRTVHHKELRRFRAHRSTLGAWVFLTALVIQHRRVEFSFAASSMASDDLLAEWRECFERVNGLEWIK